MSFRTRFQGWMRQLRRNRAFTRYKADLREFVYLDEVSVYSLIASQLGPIASEFTKTETDSLQGEVAGSFGANIGIVKSDVNSRVLETQTHGSQVLRKSIVQTTFKELYELEMGSLAIRPISESTDPPEIHDLEGLIAAAKASSNNGWIINPNNLTRGCLVEIEVQLEAEPIFRVSSVISALRDILEEYPEMFGVDSSVDFNQLKFVDRIIEKLLVGLVPVRGCAVDYMVAKLGEQEWIVHNKLLHQLTASDSPPTTPLYVVGVAEQSLFWKDIRRILFSKSHFRVLCRVSQNCLQSSWTPVKLVHVLETVAPGFAEQINSLGSGAFTNIANANMVKQNAGLTQRMKNALVGYSKLLADHYERTITSEALAEVDLLSENFRSFYGSQRERREAFDAIAKYILDHLGIDREPLVVAEYRAVAMVEAGLDFSGRLMPIAGSVDNPSTITSIRSTDERFIDSEFIAIYW